MARVRFSVRRRRTLRRRSSRPKRYYRSKARRFGMVSMKKFFSETFQASALTTNQGGTSVNPGQLWTANIGSVPEFSSYKTLYKKYRIVKLEWIFLPDFGPSDPNNVELVAASAPMWDANVRMNFVKDYSGDPSPAADELEQIEHQGNKIIMLSTRTKPVRVNIKYPVTIENYLVVQGASTTQTSVPRNRWCDFDDTTLPEHGSLLTYTVTRSLGAAQGANQPIAATYCKVTFECKDPR